MVSKDNNNKKSEIDVGYVAKLARLALTADEIKRLGKQLNDILGYIGKLNNVDTAKVQPTSHVLPLKNVERTDKVVPSLRIEETLKNAPLKENSFFKVPKVIE
ncbi:MAG: Asp-tRNA(Asn)/Glu-tRNA(Gln) amidotransferase subunit GatC [Candidatus Omnitrophica bacterium]|nr:Asp-tRNA(Asn)/Glu-tRNA(Gln) amidotransferase subunit GatC [Candidatus Omnitrophota bacterium]